MSNDLDFDDLFEDDTYTGNELISRLRKALKAQQKANKAQADELEATREEVLGLKKSVQKKSIAELLEAKGAKPSLAKYVGDIEPTEEAIEKWLDENGDDFGYKKPEAGKPEGGTTDAAGQVEMPAELAQILAQMSTVQRQEASAVPGSTGLDDQMSEFLKSVETNATSFDEAEAALRKAGLFNLPES